MKKIDFNNNWICYQKGKRESAFALSLPHDAMLLDEKDSKSVCGVNNGWIMANDYVYEKTLKADPEWKDKNISLYFEGVYHKANVYINNVKKAYHHYGYTHFMVDITDEIDFSKDNILRVEVTNSDQPNSRWYSGTGIYRPVWLEVRPKKYIKPFGLKIKTVDFRKGILELSVKTNAAGSLKAEIFDPDGNKVWEKTVVTDGDCRIKAGIDKPKLWNSDSPDLYNCKVTFGEDSCEEKFGIREVSLTKDKGLCINGKRKLLLGACIHHDEGILGAAEYDFAAYRKIKILKDNGYNAVRSAHNPCSEAVLRACDELGMLVMDEYVDMWYMHKTKYDYATEVESNFAEDFVDMVDKDFNHPSVIIYSTGNEVGESAQERGIKLCARMTEELHRLDPTRPVSCGINIFFNLLSSMGFGVYSDKKAEQEAADTGKKKAVGSEFFNNLAGLLGADFMKWGASLYPCDLKTKGAFAAMDVAGYNYGIKRYEHDLKKYPDRYILGSETFCSDAYKFMKLAKKNPRIIGDFVWSGIDYLGEVGVGSWEYADYAPDFSHGKGWVAAGSGRIDLTGKPLAEMSYTRVAFGIDKIGLAVVPVCYTDQKHSPSAWKMSNAMESWSWRGCEGADAKVEVYAKADHVSLFLNKKKLGTKRFNGDCKFVFKTKYHDGELKAVAFDGAGKKLAEKVLRTASEETVLTLEPENKRLEKNDLAYIRLKFTDKNGIVKPMERAEIKIEVEGGKLLAFGSACPYYIKSYLSDTADTYYGEALAIVKPDGGKKVKINAYSRIGNAEVEIEG
ncbi:MAG: DUF4982 domain-containing protein [Lachnospiraceae bacterium]|nr:DUF4982 domain-containing protein [Lachnospiraceae bacterium]